MPFVSYRDTGSVLISLTALWLWWLNYLVVVPISYPSSFSSGFRPQWGVPRLPPLPRIPFALCPTPPNLAPTSFVLVSVLYLCVVVLSALSFFCYVDVDSNPFLFSSSVS